MPHFNSPPLCGERNPGSCTTIKEAVTCRRCMRQHAFLIAPELPETGGSIGKTFTNQPFRALLAGKDFYYRERRPPPPPPPSPLERLFPVDEAMRARNPAAAPFALLPLGDVKPEELDLIEDVCRTVFGASVKRLPAVEMAPSSYDRSRGQWDADRLLEHLFDKLPEDASRILGVLNEDMYAIGRTFVFGYAHLRDAVAVYSTARLREAWYGRAGDEQREAARTFRVVVHELGHTFGNPHCDDSACVMHSVNGGIELLDTLSPALCSACRRKVEQGLRVDTQSAEGYFTRAGALLRRRHTWRAIEAYREATKRAPHMAQYHNDLGVALLAAADRNGAREAFRKAADLRCTFPHPYYNLGVLCREEGGASAAEPWFNKGIALDPDRLSAHRYVARLYEDTFSDQERAKRHYATYVSLGGNDTDVLERAWALGVGDRPLRKGYGYY